jgi:hypothetical protein
MDSLDWEGVAQHRKVGTGPFRKRPIMWVFFKGKLTETSLHIQTRDPIIEGYDPPEGWGWCYVDEISLDLGGRTTPHKGPIPRYY